MPGSREWTKKGVILPIKDLVPETAVTDKGPQFSAAFARDCDFTHVINSPWYPPRNERKDSQISPDKALVAYWATPLSHRSSPAELLMGLDFRATPACQSRQAAARMA